MVCIHLLRTRLMWYGMKGLSFNIVSIHSEDTKFYRYQHRTSTTTKTFCVWKIGYKYIFLLLRFSHFFFFGSCVQLTKIQNSDDVQQVLVRGVCRTERNERKVYFIFYFNCKQTKNAPRDIFFDVTQCCIVAETL